MTRPGLEGPAPIAAAKWPLVLIATLAAVAIVAATPFLVHAALEGRVAPRVANWAALAVGAGLLVALAAAWVTVRARRVR